MQHRRFMGIFSVNPPQHPNSRFPNRLYRMWNPYVRMNPCGRVEEYLRSIWTMIAFPPEERARETPWIGDWVGLSGFGLFDDALPGIEYDSFDIQRIAESTCRLLYQGTTVWHDSIVITVESATRRGPWVSEWNIRGVFKKRPNICYKNFIAHFTTF